MWRCAHILCVATNPTYNLLTSNPSAGQYLAHNLYLYLARLLYLHIYNIICIYNTWVYTHSVPICECTVILYGSGYLPVYRFQHSFVIGGDSNRSITNMVVSGMGVWLSLQNSAVLRLVHSVTYEILAEVNTAPAVTKMLSSKYTSLPTYNVCRTVFRSCVVWIFYSSAIVSLRHNNLMYE